MEWTEEEKNEIKAAFVAGGLMMAAIRAVELVAARGGTMTAEHLAETRAAWFGREGEGDVEDMLEHITAQGARVAVLEETLAERKGASILDKNAIRLQRERADVAEKELAEARATIARLTAAGQALSEHADKAGEPIPSQCEHGCTTSVCNCGNADCGGCFPS